MQILFAFCFLTKLLKNHKLPRILKVAENLKICQKVAKQVTKHAVRPFPFHLAMNFEVSTKLFRPAVSEIPHCISNRPNTNVF